MTDSQDQASAAALSAMKLPQLQDLANKIGLKGTSRMRKGELLEAIKSHSSHAGTPADATRTDRDTRAEQPARAERDTRAEREAGAEQPTRDARAERPTRAQAPKSRAERPAKAAPAEDSRPEQSKGGASRAKDQRRGESRQAKASQASQSGQTGHATQAGQGSQDSLDVLAEFDSPEPDMAAVASLDDIQLPAAGDEDATDPNARRRRARDRRERNKRRPNQREQQSFDEVDVLEGDELIPIAGVLDVLDNYAFVRTTGYLPGASDVYVNLGMVRRHGLRRGDAITGAVKQPREGESSSRQKFNALVTPELVNNSPLSQAEDRPEFENLPAIFPQKYLALGDGHLNRKLVDVLAPIAFGSRVLITASPDAPRLAFLADIAQGVAQTAPQAHLMMLLIDERPEDATKMQRNIHGEVIASSFDRSGSDHTTVAALAIERAKRLVELGQDVVVIVDSLTALARAYHTSTTPSSRILEHGWDASTVLALKQLFGAGRNIENGGSLTLIATGVNASAADEFVLSELRPVANSHISLEEPRDGVALVPTATRTRNLEEIFDVDEVIPRIVLSNLLAERPDAQAWLSQQLSEISGARFLADSVKVTPRQKAEIRRALA